MKKETVYRWLFYVLGLMMLGVGIVLNTKSGIGMAPILSMVFSLSQIYDLNFSDMTLYYYILLVAVQFLVNWKKFFRISHLLQIPLSILFTRFMNLISAHVTLVPTNLFESILITLVAVCFSGVGVFMAVNMRLVPNPGDGIVQSISDRTGISLGMSKNLFDGGSALVAIVLSLILRGHLIGIGIGTLINILGTGRVVALCTKFFKDKMMRRAFGDRYEPISQQSAQTEA